MYKALVSFCGVVSMAEGDVRELTDNEVIKDLINAGYIEEIQPAEDKAKPAKKTATKRTKKGD